jgi:pyruvate/2-oxoacid:ferredoxin oxidoreductase alpha subunit
VKVGLLRPKTLFPLPKEIIESIARKGIPLVVVELSSGQMADDIELASKGMVPVSRYLTMGGETPTVAELVQRIEEDFVHGGKK